VIKGNLPSNHRLFPEKIISVTGNSETRTGDRTADIHSADMQGITSDQSKRPSQWEPQKTLEQLTEIKKHCTATVKGRVQ